MKKSSRSDCSSAPRLHPLIAAEFAQFARQLRDRHPQAVLRNGRVFSEATAAFAERGYIELIGGKRGVPRWMPNLHEKRLRRLKGQEVWVPGFRYPDSPIGLSGVCDPRMDGEEIIWNFSREPSQSPLSLDRQRLKWPYAHA